VLDQFTEGNVEFLVLEWPLGETLLGRLGRTEAECRQRYGWLAQIAAGLQALHSAGAIYEGINPDAIVIGANSQPRNHRSGGRLPVPLPPNPPIRATLYNRSGAMVVSPNTADMRSDM